MTLWETIDQACHQELALKEYFESNKTSWLKSLAQASQNLIESEGVDHSTSMRLFGLGPRIYRISYWSKAVPGFL